MNIWLFKTEPSNYSFSDLERDQETVWDGVTNALALKYLRQVKTGDLALIYHTGDEKQIVGLAEIVRGAYVEDENSPRLAVCDVKIKQRFPHSASLAQIKADPAFSDWELVKNSRLSVMPVPDAIWKKLQTLLEHN